VISPGSVRAAIGRVVDPCSNAMGVPLDVADMGLVTQIAIDHAAGSVSVTMCVTSACCSYGPAMATALEAELQGVPGVHHASVTIDHRVVWTPDRLSPDASERLEQSRARTRALTALTPYDWSTREASP
jgi:metal-sulfur cluster biosynthetic enzyme